MSLDSKGCLCIVGNVNRGALHAELEGGVHVVTCHVTPKATTYYTIT